MNSNERKEINILWNQITFGLSPYKKTICLSCKMVVHGFIIISDILLMFIEKRLCFESVYLCNTVSQNLTKNLMKYQTLIFFLATLVTLCETLRKCHVVLELLLHEHSVKIFQVFCWKYFFRENNTAAKLLFVWFFSLFANFWRLLNFAILENQSMGGKSFSFFTVPD